AAVRDSDCTYAAVCWMLRSVSVERKPGISVPGIPFVTISAIDARDVAWRSVPCRFGPMPPSPSLPWHHAHCASKIRRPSAASLDSGVREGRGVGRDWADAPAAAIDTRRLTPARRLCLRSMRRIIGPHDPRIARRVDVGVAADDRSREPRRARLVALA